MRALRLRCAIAACVLPSCLLAACLKPTEVTLEITTDTCNNPAASANQGTNITVVSVAAVDRADASFPPSAQTSNCSDGSIGTLVVVPGPSGNGPLKVTVATGLGADPDICSSPEAGTHCIVENREITLVDNTPLYLPIAMRNSCAGIFCLDAGGTTCIDGKCVSDEVSCNPNGACSSLDGDGGAFDAGADARFPDDAPRARDAGRDGGHDATTKDAGELSDSGKHDATLLDSGLDAAKDAPAPCGGQLLDSGGCLETLAENETFPWAIAVAGPRVYWTTQCTTEAGNCFDGGSLRVESDGSATELESHQNAATAIAASDSGVYWTTRGSCTGTAAAPVCTGRVATAPLTGGAPTTLSGDAQQPLGIAASGETVCWVDNGNDRGAGDAGVSGSVWCKTGGSNAIKVSGPVPQAFSGGIAIDQEYVYWTNFGHDSNYDGLTGTLVRGTITGGAVVTLATNQNYIVNVAASDADVFWMDQVFDASNGTSFGSIHGAVIDASDSHVLRSGFGLAFNLAVDDKYVYWAASAHGTVLKMSRSGGEVTVLASGQSTPSNVVLDDKDSIYWTNNGMCPPTNSNAPCTGSVMKLTPR